MMAPPHSAAVTALATVTLCLAVAVVFRPLLAGGFFLDDLIRLYDLANFGLGKLLLSQHGGHMPLASNGVYRRSYQPPSRVPRRWQLLRDSDGQRHRAGGWRKVGIRQRDRQRLVAEQLVPS